MRLYIAVLDQVPQHMVPTLVAHTMLGAHLNFARQCLAENDEYLPYQDWLLNSFKKCVVKVNLKEFKKIAELPYPVFGGYENTVLNGEVTCLIPLVFDNYPNVLKFAKLWTP